MIPKIKESFLNLLPESTGGVIAIFNIADFKRRNSFLGHEHGDKDIAEFDAILSNNILLNEIGMRVGGDIWAVFLSKDPLTVITEIIGKYYQTIPVLAGWQCLAISTSGKELESKSIKPTRLERALRCVYLTINSKNDAIGYLDSLYNVSHLSQVNKPLNFAEVNEQDLNLREEWQCLQHDVEKYSCPFCQSSEFNINEGGWGVFSGDGSCKICGAKVSFKEFISFT